MRLRPCDRNHHRLQYGRGSRNHYSRVDQRRGCAEAACQNSWSFAPDKVTGNITLYAKWKINKYTVTFNSRSGTAVAPISVQYGTVIIAPVPPTRSVLVFQGWYKEAASTNPKNFTKDTVTADITLYAKWVTTTPTRLVASSTSYSSVTISWNTVPGAAGYQVYRSSSCTGIYALVGTVTTTGFTNTGLTTGTTYYYKVRSYMGTAKVYSAFSSVASAKPNRCLPRRPRQGRQPLPTTALR